MVQGGKVTITVNVASLVVRSKWERVSRFAQGFDEKHIKVLKLLEKRVGAPIALTCYEETEQSKLKREENAIARKQCLLCATP